MFYQMFYRENWKKLRFKYFFFEMITVFFHIREIALERYALVTFFSLCQGPVYLLYEGWDLRVKTFSRFKILENVGLFYYEFFQTFKHDNLKWLAKKKKKNGHLSF